VLGRQVICALGVHEPSPLHVCPVGHAVPETQRPAAHFWRSPTPLPMHRKAPSAPHASSAGAPEVPPVCPAPTPDVPPVIPAPALRLPAPPPALAPAVIGMATELPAAPAAEPSRPADGVAASAISRLCGALQNSPCCVVPFGQLPPPHADRQRSCMRPAMNRLFTSWNDISYLRAASVGGR
jgi:hypothetical protein